MRLIGASLGARTCFHLRRRHRRRRRERIGARGRDQAGDAGRSVRRRRRSGGAACRERKPLRTVAIAEGPRRLLEHIGAWAAIERHAQPILSMAIMDGDVRDAVRLPHLHFAAKDRAPLAHMAFNDDVVGALSALCDRLGVRRIRASVAHWAPGKRIAEIGLSDGRALARAPRCRRRRRALETQPARRHSDHRLGL